MRVTLTHVFSTATVSDQRPPWEPKARELPNSTKGNLLSSVSNISLEPTPQNKNPDLVYLTRVMGCDYASLAGSDVVRNAAMDPAPALLFVGNLLVAQTDSKTLTLSQGCSLTAHLSRVREATQNSTDH